MNEQRTFVPSGSYLFGVGAENADNCSCHIEQKGLRSKIVSEDRLKLHQYSLVWEVSLGDELKDVKPQV